MSPAASAYLVRGDDPSLVAQEVRTLLADVVGEARTTRSSLRGDLAGRRLRRSSTSAPSSMPSPSPRPFLIDLRVVVVRDAGRLLTADVPRSLIEIVQEPLPATVLVLVAYGGGTIPAALIKAISAKGEIVDVSTSKAGDRKAWLSEHLRAAPVHLDRGASDLLADHVGEDLGRVEGLLSALSAAYGEGGERVGRRPRAVPSVRPGPSRVTR